MPENLSSINIKIYSSQFASDFLASDIFVTKINIGVSNKKILAWVIEVGVEPTCGRGKYASAKVGQQGGPIFADGRGRRGRGHGRRHGLEEWCDLSCKKVV